MALAMAKKAVFLDRDGTLNEDPGYISKPEQMHLYSGVGAALHKLQSAGFLLVVVSNQSGVGRGMIQVDELPRVHERLDELLSGDGVRVDHYEICVHHPKDECDCRKPKPELLLRAAQKLGIDLARSYMVGDKLSDLEAGRNARVHATALVRTGCGKEVESQLKNQADFIGDSLLEVANWILGQET